MSNLTPRINLLEPNKIINGNFDIWQRGTSGNVFGTGGQSDFAADRFKLRSNGSTSKNIDLNQQANAPTLAQSGFTSTYSLEVDNQSGISPASDDFVILEYIMEGYDTAPIIGKTMLLGFWVWSDVTGTFSVAFRHDDVGPVRTYIREYTIDSANTWELKFVTVPVVDGTDFKLDNGAGFRVIWPICAGSGHQGSANAWQDGEKWATSSHPNLCVGGNDTGRFRLSQVRFIEVPDNFDSTATDQPFRLAGRNFAEELALCERYFQKTYNLGTDPGSVSNAGIYIERSAFTGTDIKHINLLQRMRSEPSIVFYNPNSGATGSWRDTSASADRTVTVSTGTGSESRFGVNITSAVDTNTINGHWTADAEL